MRLSLSVVSHGHGAAVLALLAQLAGLTEPRLARVLLTLNRAEPGLAAQAQAMACPFELVLIENAQPQGFGANHNHAFALDRRSQAPADAFAVVNPDIRLRGNPFDALLAELEAVPRVGAAYPGQQDAVGRAQDHERRLPTPARLLWRSLARLCGQRPTEVAAGQAPDWVNAAFLLLRAEAWVSVGGFDDSYHMYCEDVDLCLRLQMAGWHLRGVPVVVVEHDAQRASHRLPRHLAWHLRSLLRLWRSPAYGHFRQRQVGQARF